MTETPTEQAPNKVEQPDSFVSYLEGLRERDDRAALAAMRRWLANSAGSQVEAMRAVQPQLSETDGNVREASTYLIGALFALHDEPNGKGNMGDHFRDMFPVGEDPPPNVESRFMSLLATDAESFDVALRQAVMLLKSRNVPVNWHLLIRQAAAWKSNNDRWRDSVRKKWASSFWRKRSAISETATAQVEDSE